MSGIRSRVGPEARRDWVDIIGTGLVVVATIVLVFMAVTGVIRAMDRADARERAERMACLEAGWLWADDRCLPIDGRTGS